MTQGIEADHDFRQDFYRCSLIELAKLVGASFAKLTRQ
jgi:hypothetical protein